MTDAQIVMLIMGIFYAAGFVGLIVLEVHLVRILISLRPENCEKCTGFFKEKRPKSTGKISCSMKNLTMYILTK